VLPSNASTISGNPAASVSSPIVICGSSTPAGASSDQEVIV